MASENFIVTTASEVEYQIKKSRFIAVIKPIVDEQDALEQLRRLALAHPQAGHLAFAWRIRHPQGLISERCHDAGEPSGTAGRPILAPLAGKNLINTVVGVIRYFGGIKLGTGGLTRAYGHASKLAIEQAQILPWVEMTELMLEIDYSALQPLQYQLQKIHGRIIDQQFSARVKVVICLPAQQCEQIKQQFSAYQ